jgi:putative colanic acid biosynthesis acetyltransferase WcaF
MNRFQDLRQFRIEPNFRGRNPIFVQLWWLVQEFLVRPSPQICYGWRRYWWRVFGARIGKKVLIRSRARVTFPWKLSIGDYSWIGDDVELYNLGYIEIGSNSVISQKSYICTGTHEYRDICFPLVAKPIKIGDEVWIGAGTMVVPGITIGRGVVVGAGSLVLSDLTEGTLNAGHPAVFIKMRSVC